MKKLTKTKSERFAIFIRKLTEAPPAGSRDTALALLQRVMDAVEDEHSGKDKTNYTERMHIWGWEFNWRDLSSDPCYWDDSVAKKHRTQIYYNGRIVITDLKSAVVVLDKPGT